MGRTVVRDVPVAVPALRLERRVCRDWALWRVCAIRASRWVMGGSGMFGDRVGW